MTALLLLAGSLASCGFQPMYRQDRAAQSVLRFAHIDIRPDPKQIYASDEERLVQMIRNELIDRLQSASALNMPHYTVLINAVEGRGTVLVTRTEAVSRFNLSVTTAWQLLDSDGIAVLRGSLTTLQSYNVLRQEFANISAETDARQRAARDIADQLRIRLALYFEQRAGT